jgi:alpha-ketoglutarate-dependent taurine dioxygenase
MIETTPLTPILDARITGIDIARGVDKARMAELRDALDRFSVLVFPDQRIDDAAQSAFSEGFGPLERTRSGQPSDHPVQYRPGRRDRAAHRQTGTEQQGEPDLAP